MTAPAAGWLPPAPPEPPALRRLGDAVDWAVVAIGATLITLVFVNVLLHVVDRDLAWVTFLGGASATRRGAQMTITEFIDKTHGGARRAADLAVNLLTAVVLLALIWYGARLAAAGWGNELTVLGIPMTFQYLGMPVGCAAMLVFVVRDLFELATGRRAAAPQVGSGA